MIIKSYQTAGVNTYYKYKVYVNHVLNNRFTLCINNMCSTPAVLHIKTIKRINKSYQTAGVYTYYKTKVYICYVNHVLNNRFTFCINNMCSTPQQGYGSIAPRPAVLHIKTIKMIIKSYQTAGVLHIL